MSYEPMQTQVAGSTPVSGSLRTFKFLENIAHNNSVSSISLGRRIMTLKTQLQKQKQDRRKVKYRIKGKYTQLENIENQIDSLTAEISRLTNYSREADSDEEVDLR